eukprot:2366787-Prorocentrum_lima.AAC.1
MEGLQSNTSSSSSSSSSSSCRCCTSRFAKAPSSLLSASCKLVYYAINRKSFLKVTSSLLKAEEGTSSQGWCHV